MRNPYFTRRVNESRTLVYAKLDTPVVEAILRSGQSWLLHRYRHRREHLGQIERGLVGD